MSKQNNEKIRNCAPKQILSSHKALKYATLKLQVLTGYEQKFGSDLVAVTPSSNKQQVVGERIPSITPPLTSGVGAAPICLHRKSAKNGKMLSKINFFQTILFVLLKKYSNFATTKLRGKMCIRCNYSFQDTESESAKRPICVMARGQERHTINSLREQNNGKFIKL